MRNRSVSRCYLCGDFLSSAPAVQNSKVPMHEHCHSFYVAPKPAKLQPISEPNSPFVSARAQVEESPDRQTTMPWGIEL